MIIRSKGQGHSYFDAKYNAIIVWSRFQLKGQGHSEL